MSNFIEVTEDGEKFLVNTEHIVAIEAKGTGTIIFLSDFIGREKKTIECSMSYEQLKSLV